MDEIKKCRSCGTVLNDKNWADYHKKNYQYICKTCNKEYQKKWMRKWRQKNPEKSQLSYNSWRRRIKEDVLKHYSNNSLKCSRCGFSDIRALTIDHISGGGNEHRKELRKIGIIGSSIYWWLKKNNYPEGFQVLCMNCQFIKCLEKIEKNG